MLIAQTNRFPNLAYRLTATQIRRLHHAETAHRENARAGGIPAPIRDPLAADGSPVTSDRSASCFRRGGSCM